MKTCNDCIHSIGNIYGYILCTKHLDLKVNREIESIPKWCPLKEVDPLEFIKNN
jgi:hypothetical protein